MIITCPHCQTKYQVTYEAIGSAGRKVQCAHCQQAWQQVPLDKETPGTPEQKKASEVITEDGLDDAMAAEEHKVASEVAKRLAMEKLEKAAEEAQHKASAAAGKIEAAVMRKRQRDFSKRQNARVADLPLAKLRRSLRIGGALALVGIAATAYFGRVQVVEKFPAMAGVYEAVGLGVNVVGLDFSNVTTLQSLRDGKEVLSVSAQIVGLQPDPVVVPAVVVTLLDSHGQGVYEWSVTPAVRDLMAGERATFDTQLTLPPGEASSVRLSFAGGHSIPIVAGGGTPATASSIEHDAPTGHAEPAGHEPAAPAAATEHTPTPEHH
ncbi:MJ0042 family finger-like domain-containing protein [Devosia sp. YR412]|uniref:zinc-ribbon domain-containing protein n=1 Tax=Devosia sp. YR412 TaxID=1881030 RepID=UPI0008C459CD|nr:zinc-ribbon domain-containing protein [Devosia sp. YR412]SEQ28891.1 MJ0042 family finger-like domain-containing protein [Devosia sp. YR412]